MITKKRTTLMLLTVLSLLLAACSGAFQMQTSAVDSALVTRAVRYFENGGNDIGPLYNFAVEVPESWIGEFSTSTISNRVAFEYIASNGESTPIFYVDALSPVQFWEQSGSYPGDYTNIANKIDTYFVYSLPINDFNSNLSDEEFEALAAQVPDVMSTFVAELADE